MHEAQNREIRLTLDEVEADTAAALCLLWQMHCQVQLHPCHYGEQKINDAVNGIMRLREKARLRYEETLL